MAANSIKKFLVFILLGCSLQAQAVLCSRPDQIFKYNDLRISIFYGYIDQTPYDSVLDLHNKNELVQKLQQSCSVSSQSEFNALCGFTETSTSTDNAHFEKTVNGKKVEIFIYSSALSESDRANQKSSEQQHQSEFVKSQFDQELLYSDVIIYQGHARYGYGPDFFPPRLKQGPTVDVSSYKSEKKNLSSIVQQLTYRAQKIPILGLFSCDSEKHFGKTLTEAKVAEKLILTENIQYATQLQKPLFQLLNNIFTNQCVERKLDSFKFH